MRRIAHALRFLRRKRNVPRFVTILFYLLTVVVVVVLGQAAVTTYQFKTAEQQLECSVVPANPAVPGAGRTAYVFVNGLDTTFERFDETQCAFAALLNEHGLLISGWPRSGSNVGGVYIPNSSVSAAARGRYTIAALLELSAGARWVGSFTVAVQDVIAAHIGKPSYRTDLRTAYSVFDGHTGKRSRVIVVAHSQGAAVVQQAVDAIVEKRGPHAAAEDLACIGVLTLGAFNPVALYGIPVKQLWTNGDIPTYLPGRIVAPDPSEVVQLPEPDVGLGPPAQHAIVETYFGREPVRSEVAARIRAINSMLDERGCPGASTLPPQRTSP
jgi:pimeloyl-ACP methyl ester carboxylesterase